MLARTFSRFSPRFPRSLTYMLQASEYYLGDYFEWYFTAADFNKVESVEQLDKTKKALVIWAAIWIEHLAAICAIIAATYIYHSELGYWPLLGILAVPFLLPYFAAVPVMVVKYLIQKPYELFITKKLAEAIAKHPGIKIAIAGSYGKTTMREILRTVLGSGKRVAAPGGSINTLLGINNFMKTLKGDEEVLVFELGEYYPGDVAHLAKVINPDIGVITGVNESHLKRFGSIEKTVATIFELADNLGSKSLYINAENKLAKAAGRGSHIFYSGFGCGDYRVSAAKSGLAGTDFTVQHGDQELVLHTDLLGLHLVGSLVAAMQIGHTLGISDQDLVAGVAATKPFSRRLELASNKDGIYILDDSYNGNPDGVKAVIDFLSGLKGHQKLYVTSGLVEMGAKNREVHLEIAKELVAAKIDKVLLVRTSMTEIVAEGLTVSGYKGEVLWYDSTIAVHKALPHLTVKGDVVLLSTDLPDQYR